MKTYHYTECGLDDVILCNIDIVQDDEGEEVIIIPRINVLHRQIASAVISSEGAIGHKELRFLRTELGLTQDELAEILHRERLTIGRWERGECAIDNVADMVVRLLIAETLGIEAMPIAELSSKCAQVASKTPIKIDGSDPENYKIMDAA